MALVETIAIPLLPLLLGMALLAQSRRVQGRLREAFLIGGVVSVGLTLVMFTTMSIAALRSRDPLLAMSNAELLKEARAGRPALHVLADRLADGDLSDDEMRTLADVALARLGTFDSDGQVRLFIPNLLIKLRDRGVLTAGELGSGLAAALQLELVSAERCSTGQPVPVAITTGWPWLMRPVSAWVQVESVRITGGGTRQTLDFPPCQLRRGRAFSTEITLSTSAEPWDASPLALRPDQAARVEAALPALSAGDVVLQVDVRVVLSRATNRSGGQPEILADEVRTLKTAVTVLPDREMPPAAVIDDDAARPSIREEGDHRPVGAWSIRYGALSCSGSPISGTLDFSINNPPAALLYDVRLRIDGRTISVGRIWQRAGTDQSWHWAGAFPLGRVPLTAVLLLVPDTSKAEQTPIDEPVLRIPIEIPLHIERQY